MSDICPNFDYFLTSSGSDMPLSLGLFNDGIIDRNRSLMNQSFALSGPWPIHGPQPNHDTCMFNDGAVDKIKSFIGQLLVID